MTQQTRRISEKYFQKHGGIDVVFNDLGRKMEYEKFLAEILNKIGGKNVSWKQKRSKGKK